MRNAEEQLKASAKELSDLKAALDEHAIVAITDPQGRITYVNDKFCTISKYSREELLGQDHRIINSGHHPKEFIRDLWTTIARGRVWHGEIKNKAKDGSFYWVDTTIVPFLDPQGKPRQYVAIRADITERKRVEEHAVWLASFPERNPNPIVELDFETGVIHYSNHAANRLFPDLRNEGLQHPWLADLTEVAEALFERQLESARREIMTDGLCYSQTITYVSETKRLRVYGTDVTERKQAEAGAAQLAAIVEFSDDAIIGKDLQGVVTSWNVGAEKLFGYGAGEMVGQSITRLIPVERQREETEILGRIRRGESVKHFDTLRLRKDGGIVPISVTVSPIKDSAGKIIGASKVARDITERQRAEEQLKASYKEVGDLKAALDEHAIVAITDPQGRITYVNDKFCTISKYSREELLGQDHRIINSAYHPKEFICNLWTTIAHGRVWHGEIKNKAKDGSYYWVDTTIVPFLGENGKPRQYVAIRADITERKRAEEALLESYENLEHKVTERTVELQSAKERAEAAGRAKSEFMASMSHELRTPLNGIIGFSEFLVDGKPGPLNPKQKEYLGDILNSGRHLLQLINDVLDLAKVEAGKLEFNPESFLLSKAIDEVRAVAGPIGQKKRIQVGVTIAPELDKVTLDQIKFKQVVYNLVSNALKFTDAGGHVDIHCAPNGPDQFTLTVKDSGIGIKPEHLERLFKEFEQIDSGAGRRYEGTGLGLALTRKLVELQGGGITVESEPGEGSTFTVTLPLTHREAKT